MNQKDYILAHLSFAIWNDPWSRQDDMVGLISRSIVIANRSKAGWQNGDFLKIMAEMERFEANPRPDDLRYEYGDPREPLFGKFLWRLEMVWEGSEKDITNRGLFWARLDQPITPWFQKAVLDHPELHQRTGVAGMATFFS